MMLVIAGTMVVSLLSWVLLETPVRKKKILQDRQSLFRVLFFVLFALGLSGMAIAYFKGVPARFSAEANLYAAGTNDNNLGFLKCFKEVRGVLDRKDFCSLGDVAKDPSFIAFGDSEMNALLPALDRMAKRHGVGGLGASYASCPPLSGIVPIIPPHFSACRIFNETVLTTIREKHIRHVILSARWHIYLKGFLVRSSNLDSAATARNSEALRRGLVLMIRQIQDAGADVWIVKSPPEYTFDVPQRLARMVVAGGDVRKLGQPLSDYRLMQDRTESVFHGLEKQGVRFVDLADYLCSGKEGCRTQEGGRSLYRDGHHLSAFGVTRVQHLFDAAFSRMSGRKKARE